MPVVEELIGLIGYKVTGTEEIKKADKALLGLKKQTAQFGTALNKSLGKAAGAQVLGKFSLALRSGVSQIAIFARALATVVGIVAGIISVAGAAAFAVLNLGTAMVRSAGEAARLRRELQLTAKGMGTKQTNIEKLGLGFRAIGLKPEEAAPFVEGVADKANDGILKKDYGAFKDAGVSILAPDGTQRDTTGVATDVMLQYLKRYAKGADLRAKAKENPKSKKAESTANTAEIDARKFAKDWGISGAMLGALKEIKTPSEFIRRMTEMNEKNPTATADQEERTKRIAEQWAQLENTTAGLSKAFSGLADVLADHALPAINAYADGLSQVFKKMGLISETIGERDARLEQQRELERGRARMAMSPELDEARKLGTGQSGLAGFWARLTGTPLEQAKAELDAARRRYEDVRAVQGGMIGKEAGQTQEKFAPVVAAAFADMVEKLRAVQTMIQPQAVPIPQPRPNITGDVGSDKRTINVTNNNTVNVAAPPLAPAAIGAASTQGTLGAVSTKGANTSTDALTAP